MSHEREWIREVPRPTLAERERPRAKNRRRTIFSDTEKDTYAQAAIQRREDAYAALLTPEGWEAFLRARLLHRYSWRNCALIAHQAPDALQVATFRQWANWGAQVQENQHASIRICGKTAKGFGTVTLFDVTQTDAAQDISESDVYPPGFEDAVQRLSAASSRPRTLADVSKAGNAIDAAHKRGEGITADAH